jgi:hypothetical protein
MDSLIANAEEAFQRNGNRQRRTIKVRTGPLA